MPTILELAANGVMVVSVFLAARNSIHTWWIGIVGCFLYGWMFYDARLYADVTLQVFFIIASMAGWFHWLHGNRGRVLPIRRTSPLRIAGLTGLSLLVAVGYGSILHQFTDAYAPFLDSLILTFSVLAQFLLMGRRVENWYAWLVVNTLAVPLYASRELYVTSAVYLAFWCNAWYGVWRWQTKLRREMQQTNLSRKDFL